MRETPVSTAAAPRCPYCHASLRPAMSTAPCYTPATTRDCTLGFLLGLAVVGFIDIGVFARRDPTGIGFASNLIVAAILTALLLLWYWRMRDEVVAQNREAYRLWQRQMDAWQHEYRCDRCQLSFRR